MADSQNREKEAFVRAVATGLSAVGSKFGYKQKRLLNLYPRPSVLFYSAVLL